MRLSGFVGWYLVLSVVHEWCGTSWMVTPATVPPEQEVIDFLNSLESNMTDLARMSSLVAWSYNTNITAETQQANNAASEVVNVYVAQQLLIASDRNYFTYADAYGADTKRKLNIFK